VKVLVTDAGTFVDGVGHGVDGLAALDEGNVKVIEKLVQDGVIAHQVSWWFFADVSSFCPREAC
jgi:hypothetical protein